MRHLREYAVVSVCVQVRGLQRADLTRSVEQRQPDLVAALVFSTAERTGHDRATQSVVRDRGQRVRQHVAPQPRRICRFGYELRAFREVEKGATVALPTEGAWRCGVYVRSLLRVLWCAVCRVGAVQFGSCPSRPNCCGESSLLSSRAYFRTYYAMTDSMITCAYPFE